MLLTFVLLSLQNGCTVLKYSCSRIFDFHYCFGYSSIGVIQFALDINYRQITLLAIPKFNRRRGFLCFILAYLHGMCIGWNIISENIS